MIRSWSYIAAMICKASLNRFAAFLCGVPHEEGISATGEDEGQGGDRSCTKHKKLPERAQSVAKNLAALNTIFGQLFGDENFITLLEAESLTALPRYLQPLYEEARDGHEIRK